MLVTQAHPTMMNHLTSGSMSYSRISSELSISYCLFFFLTVNSPITNQVTTMASNFAIVTSTHVDEVMADSSTIAYKTCLTLHVPPPETCPKVKMIKFECESHEQGWADHKDYSYS